MSSVNFNVGTSINEIEKMAKSAKVSNEIKNLIFDFCNKDVDKQITDDIELHLLNTWFAGKNRVEMPNIKTNDDDGDSNSDNFLSKCYRAVISMIGSNNENNVETSSRKVDEMRVVEIRTTNKSNNSKTVSIFYDRKDDGVVDSYQSYTNRNNKLIDSHDISL